MLRSLHMWVHATPTLTATGLSGANDSESLCRDGTKTKWRLQWMYYQSYSKNLARNGFYMLLSTYLSFLRAALPNKNAYIARNQCQGSKPGTRQNMIFVIFSFLFSSVNHKESRKKGSGQSMM